VSAGGRVDESGVTHQDKLRFMAAPELISGAGQETGSRPA
jgi:hypothetical protein